MLSWLMAMVMVLSMLPMQAFAVSSWEEEGAYLDIKDGTLVSGELYNRFVDLFGTTPESGGNGFLKWGGDFRYDSSDNSGFTWRTKTEVTSDSTVTLGEGTYYVARRTGNADYSASKSFTVRYYYLIDLAISGMPEGEKVTVGSNTHTANGTYEDVKVYSGQSLQGL